MMDGSRFRPKLGMKLVYHWWVCLHNQEGERESHEKQTQLSSDRIVAVAAGCM